jgi:hypothetical protein
VPVPDGVRLSSVDGDLDGIWVLGDQRLVLRFDGTTWSALPLPDDRDVERLRVLRSGALGLLSAGSAALRWDGSTFEELTVPAPSVITDLRDDKTGRLWMSTSQGILSQRR